MQRVLYWAAPGGSYGRRRRRRRLSFPAQKKVKGWRENEETPLGKTIRRAAEAAEEGQKRGQRQISNREGRREKESSLGPPSQPPSINQCAVLFSSIELAAARASASAHFLPNWLASRALPPRRGRSGFHCPASRGGGSHPNRGGRGEPRPSCASFWGRKNGPGARRLPPSGEKESTRACGRK